MARNWSQSKALLERARASLAGGVSSPFRAKAPVPLYFRDGKGARLTDVDGNEYIDYQLAWGPMILGYSHPKMVAALTAQVAGPLAYGAQHELEFEVSERIQKLVPCAERVAFTSSGSEALQLACRLARAFTGREKILKFEGHYHGWMDSTLLSYKPNASDWGPREAPEAVPGSCGQVQNARENVVVLPWNDVKTLKNALRTHEIAAVVMEPVLCNSGCLLPEPGYLDQAQQLAHESGALLVFDEVITGFRISPGGAQKTYSVTPDLATFGKAVGGGVPLSAIAGRETIMTQMFTRGVAFGGTFNGNPVSMAGARVVLDEIADGRLLEQANSLGHKLMQGIRQAATAPLQIEGFGTAFALHFTTRAHLREYRDTADDDAGRLRQFLLLALDEGVHSVPDGRYYVSAAHTERDIDETIDRLARAFRRLVS